MSDDSSCVLVLFATNDDFKAGKQTAGMRGVPLDQLDQQARALASEHGLPGSTVRGYDKDGTQLAIWLYWFPEVIVRVDLTPAR